MIRYLQVQALSKGLYLQCCKQKDFSGGMDSFLHLICVCLSGHLLLPCFCHAFAAGSCKYASCAVSGLMV